MAERDVVLFGNSMICSCRQIVTEIDSLNCAKCGDIACQDCYTDCIKCRKMFCKNCSISITECIDCHNKKPVTTAFMVVEGKTYPVKNPDYLIHKTDNFYVPISLKFNNKLYSYRYRAVTMRNDGSFMSDYFMYFDAKDDEEMTVQEWWETYGTRFDDEDLPM